jgi:hypothetical protein
MIEQMIGKNVLIRTVTHYHTGRLITLDVDWIELEDVAWIADTGRFADALKTGALSEVEPFPPGSVFVNRGAVIDLCEWRHALPLKQK